VRGGEAKTAIAPTRLLSLATDSNGRDLTIDVKAPSSAAVGKDRTLASQV
jgi:hypothetical protein